MGQRNVGRLLGVPLGLAAIAALVEAPPAAVAMTGPPTGPATVSSLPAPVASNWLGLGYNQDPQYSGGKKGINAWDRNAFDLMTLRAGQIRPGLVRIMVNRSLVPQR